MLVDYQYLQNSKKLVVSYVNKIGNIELKYFDWDEPFKYEACSVYDLNRHPTYKSWDGKPIKKILANYPDRYSTYEFIDHLPQAEKDEIFEFNIPKIYFIDIETATDEKGYSSPEEARTAIISLSIVYDDKIILLGLKDLSDEEQLRIIKDTNTHVAKFNIKYQLKYIKYPNEFSMLKFFFEQMLKTMPCITGWNFLNYDWKFLVNRARRVRKNDDIINIKEASLTRKYETIWGTTHEVPTHKILYDYMLLYKTLDQSVKIKESNALDFVSESLLDIKKIKVVDSNNKPITLMKLYDEDFEKFMFYNAVDSVLVQLIHNKMMYINTIFGIATSAKIKATDVYSYMNNSLASIAITEGVLRNRFREQANIVLFRDKNKVNPPNMESIEGGWVKEPKRGMNRWVTCYDFASLYPTTQRQFFIAPENFVGLQDSINKNMCFNSDGQQININYNIHVVCVNGTVFLKKMSPTIDMLTSIYNDRKKYKKTMNEKKNEMEILQKQLDELKQDIKINE